MSRRELERDSTAHAHDSAKCASGRVFRSEGRQNREPETLAAQPLQMREGSAHHQRIELRLFLPVGEVAAGDFIAAEIAQCVGQWLVAITEDHAAASVPDWAVKERRPGLLIVGARVTVKYMLAATGYEIASAADGEQAFVSRLV
jgi:hypothetical protein